MIHDLLASSASARGIVRLPHSRFELCRWFAALGFTRGAEVGVWEGMFSQAICQAVPGVHLTCVDPWACYDAYVDKKNDPSRIHAAYQATVRRLQPFHCTILRMTSPEGAARIAEGSLDFVYIDANHAAAFVWQDLNAWVPKVRSGGIVSGHDYFSHRAKHLEVQPMVDRYVAEHGIAPLYVLTGDKSHSFFWVVP